MTQVFDNVVTCLFLISVSWKVFCLPGTVGAGLLLLFEISWTNLFSIHCLDPGVLLELFKEKLKERNG